MKSGAVAARGVRIEWRIRAGRRTVIKWRGALFSKSDPPFFNYSSKRAVLAPARSFLQPHSHKHARTYLSPPWLAIVQVE